MKITSQELNPATLASISGDVLAFPLLEDEAGGPLLAAVDKALGGILERTLKDEDVKGKRGQALLVHTHGKIAASKVLLVGVGKKADLTEEGVRRYAGTVARQLDKVRAKDVAVAVPEGKVDATVALQAAAEGLELGLYRFNRYLTRDRQDAVVAQVTLLAHKDARRTPEVLDRSRAMVTATSLARDLVNEPPSTLTPCQLAGHAERAARECGLNFQEWGPKDMAKERMELLLAVSRASAEEPRMVRLEYLPKTPARKKVVLVGKGLTFDSGGLDLKTAEGMLDMKVDMSGSAAVLGAMMSVAALQPSVHVVGYMGCVENMIGGRAYKPGDVIKSRAGLTIEIGNTDAEGRLVLADVMSFAQDRENPDVMIDLATLTGACMIALGPTTAGLFSNNDELARAILAAGDDTGEDYWRMPLNESLREMIKSPIADMKNVGQRYAGAITAALFLKDFVKEGVAWAHLDIAGPATSEKDRDYVAKGGTGFGVRSITRYIAGLG
jgi:leucyl aminopeptidase